MNPPGSPDTTGPSRLALFRDRLGLMIGRRSSAARRRTVLHAVLALSTAVGVAVLSPSAAQAHGATTHPGSRTYLCYQDMALSGNVNMPRNSQCAAAVTAGTTQPLYDWFAVLRSDGSGRMSGFIPDGSLCSGGNAKYAAYDTPGTAWPVTHLTSGAPWTVHYNAWAAHPGGFRLFITKDDYDPSKPLAWSDLESVPFSTWNETVPNGQGEYYWDVTLPKKTGRHIIYSVWTRTDSTETFYGCADVVFDGGNGNVTGIPGYDGDTGTTQPPAVTPTTPQGTSAPATTPPATTPSGTTRPSTTSPRPTTPPATTPPATTAAPPVGGATSCTAQITATSSWSTGYQGALTVLNKGAVINPWNVTFTVPSGVTINNGWNGDFSTSGSTVTVKAPSWAPSVGSNAQISVGFIANGSSSPLPTGIKLNGNACGAPGDTSVPSTTASTTAPPTTAPATSAPVTTRPPVTTRAPVTVTPTTPAATPTPSASTSAMPMDCQGNASLVCDGFDNQVDGAAPTAGGHWSVVTPDCSGTSKAVIDNSVKHSGTGALRIDGVAGYCNHIFVQAEHRLDTGGPIYARLWIRHSTPQPVDHTTMIAMSDANDGGKDIRIGGQNSALQWNRQSDDATLPAQSPNGVALSTPLPIGGWQCLEFKVDGTNGTAATWLNGNQVAGLTADGVKTQDIDDQWYNKSWLPKVTNIKIGWEAYGNGADTLWYDDVAVGSARIGCS